MAELNGYNKFDLISGAFDRGGIRKGMQGTALPDTHSYDAGFTSGAKATGMHPHMHTVGGPDDPGEGKYGELNGSQPIIGYSDYTGSRLAPFVARDGKNALAQSHYRFFQPAPSGNRQDVRQTSLVHEGGGPSDSRAAGGGNGLVRKQVSSVIGTERNCDELPSFGVEDQFSKAGYGKDAHEYEGMHKPSREQAPSSGDAYLHPAYFGLVETRKPGLFTPRKQAQRLRMMMQQDQLQQQYEEGGDDNGGGSSDGCQDDNNKNGRSGYGGEDRSGGQRTVSTARSSTVNGNSSSQPGMDSARASARRASSSSGAMVPASARSGAGYGYGGGGGGSARSHTASAAQSARGGGGGYGGSVSFAMASGRSGGGGGASARMSARDSEIAEVRALS